MKTSIKKLLSALLCLVMIAGFIPINAKALDYSGLSKSISLNVTAYPQSRSNSCGHAATKAVLSCFGEGLSKTDLELYGYNASAKSVNAVEGNTIKNKLNEYLDGRYECNESVKKNEANAEEKTLGIIISSLSAGNPVIVLIYPTDANYFHWSNGDSSHNTTISGLYTDSNGACWLEIKDSNTVGRNDVKSTKYRDPSTGTILIPYSIFFKYMDESATSRKCFRIVCSTVQNCDHSVGYVTKQKSNGAWGAYCKKCGEEFKLPSLDKSTAGTYVVISSTACIGTDPYKEAMNEYPPVGTEYAIAGSIINAYGNLWYKTSGGKWIWSGYLDKVLVPPPSAPTGLSGVRSSSTSANVQLKWDAVSGAEKYQAQYSRSGVGWRDLNESPVTTNSLLAKNFSWNYDYVDFRVRAVNSGGASDWVEVRVNKTTDVLVTGVTLNKTSLSLIAGNSETLTAMISPSNATNKTVTWSSSNTSVATVSNGKVTAVNAGTATITASAGGKSASCTVTVTAPQAASDLSITINKGPDSIKQGASYIFSGLVKSSNYTIEYVKGYSDNTLFANITGINAKSYTIGRSNSSDKIYWDYPAEKLNVGKHTLKIEAKDSSGEVVTESVEIEVVGNEISVASVTLNKSSLALQIGDSETLTATVSPSNATNKTVTWSSSNTSVATVSDGKVTAVGAGATVISAACGTVTASCSVTVAEKQTAPAITTEVIASASVGTSYEIRLTASGTTPITWSVSSGTLPGGLSLDSGSGTISGTPTKAGSFSFAITAKNSVGEAKKDYTMTVAETSVTIRFETNGGTLIESKTFGKGGILDLAEYTTTRDGYEFAGWYKDVALTEAVTQIEANEDMTVYAGWEQREPSEISVTVNGVAVSWTDAVPFIDENNRTMVPLRAVAEALGLLVDWNPTAREAIFTDGTSIIYFPIGSSTARTSDGGSVTMDTAAVIVSDRTFAPIRYLAEFFSYSVDWDGASRTVVISSSK